MRNTWVKMAGGVGAAGALALSGAALSSAQSGTQNSTATPSAAASSAPSPSNGAPQGRDGGHRGHGTPVAGDTLTKVKDAVKAKDAAVTVERVFAGPDGTYHAMGTKAWQRVHVEVSKDLKTVTVRTGKGPGAGERGYGHGPRGTEVTGETLTNVKNAVKAKDSGVTVEKVFKESGGTYRALGMKSGAHVMMEVSKDLKTVTVKAGKPGGPGGQGGPAGHGRSGGPGGAPGPGSNGQAPSGQAPQQSGAGTSGAAA